MGLYNKYRPTELTQMKGNKEALEALSSMLEGLDPPHAFLLFGPTGSGKTTTARIITNKIGSTNDNMQEVDSADFRGIDTVREIQRNVKYKPIGGASARVWIIDECHSMTKDAQNALLKVLEDPPAHAYFILCTTDSKKLLPTVRGRCSQFEFKPLQERDMLKLLRSVARAEGFQVEKEVYSQIAQDSLGLPRDALQILEKVLHTDAESRLQVAKTAAEQQNQSIELCRALIKNRGWKEVQGILKGLKDQDPEGIRRHVMGYCSSVVLNADSPRAGLIMEEFKEPFYNTGFPGLVLACYTVKITHKL